ncbi:MAG: hypothetical protein ACTSRA_17115, partial [Promethearchaeota archaeon]
MSNLKNIEWALRIITGPRVLPNTLLVCLLVAFGYMLRLFTRLFNWYWLLLATVILGISGTLYIYLKKQHRLATPQENDLAYFGTTVLVGFGGPITLILGIAFVIALIVKTDLNLKDLLTSNAKSESTNLDAIATKKNYAEVKASTDASKAFLGFKPKFVYATLINLTIFEVLSWYIEQYFFAHAPPLLHVIFFNGFLFFGSIIAYLRQNLKGKRIKYSIAIISVIIIFSIGSFFIVFFEMLAFLMIGQYINAILQNILLFSFL